MIYVVKVSAFYDCRMDYAVNARDSEQAMQRAYEFFKNDCRYYIPEKFEDAYKEESPVYFEILSDDLSIRY